MLLVACGLKAEAAIAGGRDSDTQSRIVAGGGDAARLAEGLAALAPSSSAMLSFGIAGGLAPGLRPGDIRVAAAAIAPDGTRYPAYAPWADALVAALGCPPPVAFACVARPLVEPDDKAALHQRTGADLVDMESSIAAAVARRYGLPFAALRVVSDAAERALPPAVMVSMRPGGGLDLPAILLSVVKKPGQIPGLVRTGSESRRAFAALLRCRQSLGPTFALLDVG